MIDALRQAQAHRRGSCAASRAPRCAWCARARTELHRERTDARRAALKIHADHRQAPHSSAQDGFTVSHYPGKGDDDAGGSSTRTRTRSRRRQGADAVRTTRSSPSSSRTRVARRAAAKCLQVGQVRLWRRRHVPHVSSNRPVGPAASRRRTLCAASSPTRSWRRTRSSRTVMTRQLYTSGVLDAVRATRKGYPDRLDCSRSSRPSTGSPMPAGGGRPGSNGGRASRSRWRRRDVSEDHYRARPHEGLPRRAAFLDALERGMERWRLCDRLQAAARARWSRASTRAIREKRGRGKPWAAMARRRRATKRGLKEEQAQWRQEERKAQAAGRRSASARRRRSAAARKAEEKKAEEASRRRAAERWRRRRRFRGAAWPPRRREAGQQRSRSRRRPPRKRRRAALEAARTWERREARVVADRAIEQDAADRRAAVQAARDAASPRRHTWRPRRRRSTRTGGRRTCRRRHPYCCEERDDEILEEDIGWKTLRSRRRKGGQYDFKCAVSDVLEYAEYLGMDIKRGRASCCWIADAALQAPEPQGWEQRLDPKGGVYY